MQTRAGSYSLASSQVLLVGHVLQEGPGDKKLTTGTQSGWGGGQGGGGAGYVYIHRQMKKVGTSPVPLWIQSLHGHPGKRMTQREHVS